MMPLNVSLIKYDNPLLITKNLDKKSPGAATLKGTQTITDSSNLPCVSPRGKACLSESKSNQQTEEILNSILPPREWSENGQLWIQRASSTPATRLDVINLQEELDRRLQQRQARETGICPVRRELYNQVFDELIRQVTINCAERGLLLLRVRDEIRMTIAAYQTLYESSVAFGMRKALQSEQGKADMERMIGDLEQEKKDLERQVYELKTKCEQIEKRAAEQRQLEEKKHQDEIQFLKRNNQQLKAQLDGIMNPKK
ncbi:unnamed protein product [Schistosoma rodhaini]|uniref:33 kDa inner dynein arm light chain, axonemal n=1 Tax=Schistosoma rodhaini TaxID=6188 RepID=A0AA85FCG8_9TREM|nr:unnamed protein product [Schistosoma rodhaini]